MASERIPLDQFSQAFGSATELSSVAIGGQIVSVSDEFFAEAFHLLLVEPPPSLKGQFGPKGALYSGWESRRHNPTFDWVIIKLGTTGKIVGFDIDTTHFNGNEAPQASIEALYQADTSVPPTADDRRWSEVISRVDLGPSSRHLFAIDASQPANYIKLNMYPDGGIARLRAYGHVVPVRPDQSKTLYDVAHVFSGGRVVFTSDQHFGVGSNLILPGRGKDMGDGWETKRSRQPAHKDWVIIKLGEPSYLSHFVVDTAHFKGNFPQYCEIHGINSNSNIPPHSPGYAPPPTCNPPSEHELPVSSEDSWTLLLPQTYLGPHREHSLQAENTKLAPFTHVRLTIYPDGGVKRVRVIGSSQNVAEASATHAAPVAESTTAVRSLRPHEATLDEAGALVVPGGNTTILALPLTPEAFAPYGQVIQSYPDVHAAPRNTKITEANFGTALKYHKLALLESSYLSDVNATAGISVYRCEPAKVRDEDEHRVVTVAALERHPYTNQAFIPLGSDKHKNYLVAVARNGNDDGPDLSTLRAFLVDADQGVVYNTAVWHLPMTVLDEIMDLACVETQIGNGDKADCEVVDLQERYGSVKVIIPPASRSNS
ncbi:Allantoicase [Auriscalpium vulgare]|uniref:Allantoicase n=1 Tax=Auriscalpium vulgare TaxID=40419 RepID=A0ACB8R7F4_9AGAM|nr:Allantoicase [Auriscalpium vulgare]